MSDTQHAGPGAPTPRIHLPYGNPCEENVRRDYSVSFARDLWEFRSEIPPEIMPPHQVQRLAAILCADLNNDFDQNGLPDAVRGLSQNLYFWRKTKRELQVMYDEGPTHVTRMPPNHRANLIQIYESDKRYLVRRINEEKVNAIEELQSPNVLQCLESHNAAQFHEKYDPGLPELLASITLDSQHAVAWGQIDRDMVPLLQNFHRLSVYAEPERVDKFVAALLRTLKSHPECIRDGSNLKRTHLACQLTSVAENYGAAFSSPWELPRPDYVTALYSFRVYQSPSTEPRSRWSHANYQFMVDHARRYGGRVGRGKEAYYVLCSAIKRRALRHTYTARPTTNLCVIRRPMDDRPCPLRLLAGSNEILRMIARLAYPV
jgi:hypothetical protein